MKEFTIIKCESKSFFNICGLQKYDSQKRYRLSRFVILVQYNNLTLLHSCLSGEMLAITDVELNLPYLVSHWFFVEDNTDEYDMVKQIQKIMTTIYENKPYIGYDDYEILTTTCCNANCFYCYEQQYEKLTMTVETASQLVNFMAHNATGGKIRIKWYGGEPLVNNKVIDIISEGLSEKQIPYESTMISNALLFSPKIIIKAKQLWNLTNVRITIDGTEQTYNKVKSYNNANGSPFITVMRNIDNLLSCGISVTFRFNVEGHNIEDVRKLTNFLVAKYKGNQLVSFSINPLNNTDNNSNISSCGTARQAIFDFIFEMKQILSSNGFDVNFTPLPKITKHLCKADDKRHLLIKPNGGIAFCAEDFNNKSFGSIFQNLSGIIIPSRMDDVRQKGETCYNCPLFPSCTLSKDCPSILHVCDPTSMYNNIREVKQSMILAYNNYLRNHEN